jgi:hypothetical protein
MIQGELLRIRPALSALMLPLPYQSFSALTTATIQEPRFTVATLMVTIRLLSTSLPLVAWPLGGMRGLTDNLSAAIQVTLT